MNFHKLNSSAVAGLVFTFTLRLHLHLKHLTFDKLYCWCQVLVRDIDLFKHYNIDIYFPGLQLIRSLFKAGFS